MGRQARLYKGRGGGGGTVRNVSDKLEESHPPTAGEGLREDGREG